MLACLVVCGDMGGAVDRRYVVRRWVGIAVKSSGIMDEDRKKTETNTERVESSRVACEGCVSTLSHSPTNHLADQ